MRNISVPSILPLRFVQASRSTIVAFGRVALLASTRAHAEFVLNDPNSTTSISDRNGMTVWKGNNTTDNFFLFNDHLRSTRGTRV
jgi:hypothetical protein